MSKINTVFLFISLFLLSTYSFGETISQLTDRRISLLEAALAPKTPQSVAISWAKAAKNRNGAIQYMLMCPDLQQKYLSNLEALNWVTGISSPWVSDFKILSQRKNAKSWIFTIQYVLSTSGKSAGTDVDTITVVRADTQSNSQQSFCISKFTYLSPVDGL